jgi:hypothetical protein
VVLTCAIITCCCRVQICICACVRIAPDMALRAGASLLCGRARARARAQNLLYLAYAALNVYIDACEAANAAFLNTAYPGPCGSEDFASAGSGSGSNATYTPLPQGYIDEERRREWGRLGCGRLLPLRLRVSAARLRVRLLPSLRC